MKHKLLTLASAALLFAACSDTSVSDANDEIKEKGTVTIFAYDVLTRLPLKDVSVYYRTTKKTKKTDSTGTIVWKGVDIGHSYFDLQKEGALLREAVNASLDQNIRTPEIQVEGGEKYGTKEVGAWIVDYIKRA